MKYSKKKKKLYIPLEWILYQLVRQGIVQLEEEMRHWIVVKQDKSNRVTIRELKSSIDSLFPAKSKYHEENPTKSLRKNYFAKQPKFRE